jgi:hypothetical protein
MAGVTEGGEGSSGEGRKSQGSKSSSGMGHLRGV